ENQHMFWYIDPSHSQVNFSVKHMVVSTVRGQLGKLTGKLQLDPERPEKADFEITADVKGITTNDERRDGHLRSGDFFDAEKFPAISFKSNAIFAKDQRRYSTSVDLAIRESARPVSFDIELLGIGIDAMGSQKL